MHANPLTPTPDPNPSHNHNLNHTTSSISPFATAWVVEVASGTSVCNSDDEDFDWHCQVCSFLNRTSPLSLLLSCEMCNNIPPPAPLQRPRISATSVPAIVVGVQKNSTLHHQSNFTWPRELEAGFFIKELPPDDCCCQCINCPSDDWAIGSVDQNPQQLADSVDRFPSLLFVKNNGSTYTVHEGGTGSGRGPVLFSFHKSSSFHIETFVENRRRIGRTERKNNVEGGDEGDVFTKYDVFNETGQLYFQMKWENTSCFSFGTWGFYQSTGDTSIANYRVESPNGISVHVYNHPADCCTKGRRLYAIRYPASLPDTLKMNFVGSAILLGPVQQEDSSFGSRVSAIMGAS